MRDQRTEAFLERGGWKWKFHEKVELVKIDIQHSAENPARLARKIDDERVLQYAEEMENGVDFPAVVLLSPSDRELLPFDVATGMHRLSAADTAGLLSLDAYIVTEADHFRREVLLRQLNSIEGQGDTPRQQMLHLIAIKERYPEQSLKSLAKQWNLKEAAINNLWRAESAKRRSRNLGYDLDRTKVTQSSLITLQGIHGDPVFRDAVKFVIDHNPPGTVIEEMAREIRPLRDESAALGVVARHQREEAERQLRARAKTAKTSPSPANKLIGDVKRINNQVARGLEHLYLEALGNTHQARVVLEELVENSKRLLNELDRIERIRKGNTYDVAAE